MPDMSLEGKDRDCGHISHVVMWGIMAGADIQVDGCLPRIHRPYKTKGFAPCFRTLPPYLCIYNLRRQSPKPPASTSQPSSSSHPPSPIIQWSHGVDPMSPSSAWRASFTVAFFARGLPPRSGGCPTMRTRHRSPKAMLCPSFTSMSGDSLPSPTSSFRGC